MTPFYWALLALVVTGAVIAAAGIWHFARRLPCCTDPTPDPEPVLHCLPTPNATVCGDDITALAEAVGVLHNHHEEKEAA